MKKFDLNGYRKPEDVVRRYPLNEIELNSEDIEKIKQDIICDDHLSLTSKAPVQNKVVTAAIDNKVSKVAGKGLSTNDFTDSYKNASHTHTNKAVLDTITQQKIDHWDNNSIEGAFPVGKVEIFFDDIDHSDFLGFTWQRFGEGKVLVGKDTNQTEFDTLGETGGEKTHTLTANELPTSVTVREERLNGGAGNNNWATISSGWANYENGYGQIDRGQAHNNLQPYIVVNFWVRVS